MDMPSDLTLHHLRVFDRVFAERSLTRVSEILDTSQPNVSKTLARLRRHFGDPLFVRSGNTMTPTARASDLAPRVAEILERLAALETPAPAFDPASSAQDFTILISDGGAMRLGRPLVARLARLAPNLRIALREPVHRLLLPRLESGEADFAIGSFPELDADIRRRKLVDEGYACLVRPGHPFAATPPDTAAFAAARHVQVLADHMGHAHTLAARRLAQIIPRENVAIRVEGFVTAAHVTVDSDLVATMPANLARFLAREYGLVEVPVPVPLPRVDVSILWHERMHRDPGHAWLRGQLFAIMGSPARAPAQSRP